MFELNIDKLNYPLFKTALEMLAKINEHEFTFVVAENQIAMGALSQSKSEGVIIYMHPDFFEGGYIKAPEKIYTFAVQPKIVSRIAKRFPSVEIIFNENELMFKSENKRFIVPTYMPEMEFPEPLFKKDRQYSLTVPNDFISDAINDMKVDTFSGFPVVKFDLHDKKLNISRDTDWIKHSENSLDVDIDGEVTVTTSLDSFDKIMVGISRRAESTRLEIEEKQPIVAKYIFPEGMKMLFALAPYGEEDPSDEWVGEEDEDNDITYKEDDRDQYCEHGICMCCDEEKDNINPGTGCCWECDEG